MDESIIKLSNGMAVPPICYGPGMIYTDVLDFNRMKKSISIKKSKQIYADMRKAYVTKYAVTKEPQKIFIDTATAYGYAESVIGKIISKVDRNKVILCTKISARDQIRNGKNIKKIYSNSLRYLNVETIDLYLMHWPVMKNYIDVWKQMEELYLQKKVGAIGVCNCHIHHLEEIMAHGEIKPMIHQMEVHPLFTQNEERRFCNEEGIQIMAYTPIARNDDRLINSRILGNVAKKYGKTVSQVILRWHIQLGNIPVVSTKSVKHYQENNNIFDFSLSEEEMDRITSININSRLRYDSDNCDFLAL